MPLTEPSFRARASVGTLVLALGIVSSAVRAQSEVPDLSGRILTVQGPIDPADAGITLMHEHIFIDFRAPPPMRPPPTEISVLRAQAAGPPGRGSFGGGLTDFDESLAELTAFKAIGGGTIVDTTNFGLTRDPEVLRRISEASGLHVVMGAGWYQKALHPPDMSALTVEELTAIVVADVTTGAQGTGVRAGIIGEVGIQGRPLVDNEIKSIRASARAARITGAPLSLHSFAAPEEMLEALDIIESEGVALSRVVMSHTGGPLSDYLTELFGRGVFVEWDYMGQAPLGAERDAQIAATIKAAIDAGHLRQILLSHDICTAPQLAKNGGGGYTYISERIVPALASLGVTPAEIETLLVDNPRRALTFVAPAAR